MRRWCGDPMRGVRVGGRERRGGAYVKNGCQLYSSGNVKSPAASAMVGVAQPQLRTQLGRAGAVACPLARTTARVRKASGQESASLIAALWPSNSAERAPQLPWCLRTCLGLLLAKVSPCNMPAAFKLAGSEAHHCHQGHVHARSRKKKYSAAGKFSSLFKLKPASAAEMKGDWPLRPPLRRGTCSRLCQTRARSATERVPERGRRELLDRTPAGPEGSRAPTDSLRFQRHPSLIHHWHWQAHWQDSERCSLPPVTVLVTVQAVTCTGVRPDASKIERGLRKLTCSEGSAREHEHCRRGGAGAAGPHCHWHGSHGGCGWHMLRGS